MAFQLDHPNNSYSAPHHLPRNDSHVRFTHLHEAYAPTPAPPPQQTASSLRTETSASSDSLESSERTNGVQPAETGHTKQDSGLPEGEARDSADIYSMRHGWDSQYSEEQLNKLATSFYLYFNDKRHEQRTVSTNTDALDWRMRDRLKTVFAGLCLCLNIGVDPPGELKTNPAARLECWIDPLTATSPAGENIALNQIAKHLEAQYQQLSLRTKYKALTDPSMEELRKFCLGVRKSAKDERILFHYNGHGVPRPTPSGEIWVFNKDYTQYIPVLLGELQNWMGAPSLFVWDTSQAGLIVKNFMACVERREQENGQKRDPNAPPKSPRDYIHLAACREDESLPSTPEVPADLFTCCLTTPIEIAIRYFMLKNPLKSQLTEEDLSRIPGKAQERRTPIGELNWIFTAITDTIAWNMLPRAMFKKLFRQDLMVAALFRNFLLAQRVMRSFNCRPVSHPVLPDTRRHPLWQSWDLAVELVLIQVPDLRKNEGHPEVLYDYQHSDFFSQQLTAFALYLEDGAPMKKEPEQLPIVLQVLLSQVHRVRALILLSKFLDYGPWAVNLALSIGIFPYVLKLLQSQAPELKPSLIFIWTRILAVDQSCQTDLHKDHGYNYFISILRPDAILPSRQLSEHRAMCAFILAMFCRSNKTTRQAALGSELLPLLLQHISIRDTENPLLRQWSCLCLSTLWEDSAEAKYEAVKADAHLTLSELALDPVPEVRTAMLTAFTTWVGLPEVANSTVGDTETLESYVAMKLLPMCDDGSNLVRKEMAVFLAAFVETHSEAFIKVATEQARVEMQRSLKTVASAVGKDVYEIDSASSDAGSAAASVNGSDEHSSSLKSDDSHMKSWSHNATNGSVGSLESNHKHAHFSVGDGTFDFRPEHRATQGTKTSILAGAKINDRPARNMILTIWKHVQYMSVDPDDEVARDASAIVDWVERRVFEEDEETLTMMQLVSNLRHMEDQALKQRELGIRGPGRRSRPTSRDDAGSLREGQSSRAQDLTPPSTAGSGLISRTASMNRVASMLGSSMLGSVSDPTQLERNLHALKINGHDSPPQMHSSKTSILLPEEAPFHPSQVNGGQTPGLLAPTKVVKSNFFDWAKEYFTEPQMRAESEEPGNPEYDDRITRRAKNEAILDRTQSMKDEAGSSQWNQPYGHFDNIQQPVLMVSHQFEDHLAVADVGNNIRIWDWSKQKHLHSFPNGNCYGSRVTGMKFINEDDPNALLLVGSNDGAVKIYADYWAKKDCHAAAAFRGSSDSRPDTSSGNLVFDWIQTRGQLLVAGDSRDVQVWDVAVEMVDHEINLGTSSLCTSLTTDQVEGHNIAAGFNDGSVRVYDQRIGSGRHVVKQWHENTSSIVNVHLQRGGQRELVSGATNGTIKMWDIRMQESLLTVNAVKDGMTRLAVHEHAPVFAAGSRRGTVKLYNINGSFLSSIAPTSPIRIPVVNTTIPTKGSATIQAHRRSGFPDSQSRLILSPVAALAFHPHRMVLATASVGDSHVNLFTCNEDKFVLDERVWLSRKYQRTPAPTGMAGPGQQSPQNLVGQHEYGGLVGAYGNFR